MTNYKVWGVHMGVHVSDRPIEGGYIAVGWPELETWPLLRARATPLKSALPKPTQTKSRVRSQSMQEHYLSSLMSSKRAISLFIRPKGIVWLTLGG